MTITSLSETSIIQRCVVPHICTEIDITFQKSDSEKKLITLKIPYLL